MDPEQQTPQQNIAPSATNSTQTQTAPTANQTSSTADTKSFDLYEWAYRIGFATIFLVNAIYAAIHPEDFVKLLENNIVASKIGFANQMVMFTAVNDLVLGILILTGWKKRLVNAWAGIWLILVAGLKLMNLVF